MTNKKEAFLKNEQTSEIYEEILIKPLKTCIRRKNQCKHKNNNLTILKYNKKGLRQTSVYLKSPFYRFKKSPIISLGILEVWHNDHSNDLNVKILKFQIKP